jgi:hypothetical protein
MGCSSMARDGSWLVAICSIMRVFQSDMVVKPPFESNAATGCHKIVRRARDGRGILSVNQKLVIYPQSHTLVALVRNNGDKSENELLGALGIELIGLSHSQQTLPTDRESTWREPVTLCAQQARCCVRDARASIIQYIVVEIQSHCLRCASGNRMLQVQVAVERGV